MACLAGAEVRQSVSSVAVINSITGTTHVGGLVGASGLISFVINR